MNSRTRVNEQGYEQFRDMLAHILAWWEEGMEIILALADGREFERRKYDFDAFNAEAVAKYRSWDEAEFLSQFEETRQKMGADLRSMDEALFENRRVKVVDPWHPDQSRARTSRRTESLSGR